ncbi:MAG: D-Ala-D-Ala carboxypeptidase family metallohydrolase [Verrucomicrobiales bacterium]|nr:D-Ala-D-Ala carboxypeptidase family metallohydrolase [Verrucomicrobiales bacterium]
MSAEPATPEQETAPPPPRKLSRRLIVTGLIGSAVGLTAYERYGSDTLERLYAISRNRADRVTDRLRQRWVEHGLSPRHELKDEADYRAFLGGLSLRYITANEIIRPHRNVRGGIANELPPRHMWKRLVPTLRVADEIRHRLGSPLKLINSAYRSPDYNLACSGATQSFHMQNRALDLMFREGPEAASAASKELREEGFFKGGIGTYSSFIHIDTRGFDATWGA